MLSFLLYTTLFSFSIYSINLLDKDFLLENKKSKIFRYFCITSIFPIILSGERVNVGTDFENYANIYKTIASNSFLELVSLSKHLEPLYIIINKISSILFFSSDRGIFYTNAFIIFSLLYFGLLFYKKNYKFSMSYSYLIFYCYFFPLTLNIQRQMLAVMVVFVGYKYLIKEKPLKFFIMVFIASGFHTTALVLLPIGIFILLNEKWKKIYCYFLVFSPIILIILVPFIQNLSILGKYLEKYSFFDYQGVSLFRIGEVLIFLLPLILNKNLILEKYPQLKNLIPAILFLIPLITIGGYQPWANRLVYYIMILQLFLHPIVISLQSNRKIKRIWIIGILIFYIMYFILKFVIIGNEGIFPYRI